MVTKWLHVTESPGNPWVLTIWSAVNQAVGRGTCAQPNGSTGELGIYITTRLNMLPKIITRINNNWKTLYEETKTYGDEYISEKGKEGYAIPISSEIINTLLIDIDSFLFETNSCCELMMTFLREIYKLNGQEIKKKNCGKKLERILIENGQDANWFALLDKERNFIIHHATPYVAIDVSVDPPDLLIMKENLKLFNDPTKFTRLSELDMVVKGFWGAIKILQDHLITVCNRL